VRPVFGRGGLRRLRRMSARQSVFTQNAGLRRGGLRRRRSAPVYRAAIPCLGKSYCQDPDWNICSDFSTNLCYPLPRHRITASSQTCILTLSQLPPTATPLPRLMTVRTGAPGSTANPLPQRCQALKSPGSREKSLEIDRWLSTISYRLSPKTLPPPPMTRISGTAVRKYCRTLARPDPVRRRTLARPGG
jgi:hypothetical protein